MNQQILLPATTPPRAIAQPHHLTWIDTRVHAWGRHAPAHHQDKVCLSAYTPEVTS